MNITIEQAKPVRTLHGVARLAIAALFVGFTSTLAFAQDPPPLSAYGELPGIEDAAISHLGNFLALSSNIQGERRLIILERDNPTPNIIGADDLKVRGFDFVGDQSLIIYRSMTVDANGFAADQYELSQAIVIPLAEGQEMEAVFAGTARLNNAIFGQYGLRRVDGNWQGFFGALENKRGSDGYVFDHGRPSLRSVDLATMETTRAAPSAQQGRSRDWLVGEDGEVIATFEIIISSGAWTIRNESDQIIARGSNPNGDAGFIGIGYDGDSVIYSTEDVETGLTDWFEVHLETGESAEFLPGVAIDRTYWDRTSGRLIGYLARDADDAPIFQDPVLQERARRARQAFAGQSPRLVDWNSDMTRAIIHTDGQRNSGTWYLVDLESSRAEELGYDYPLLSSAMVGPTSSIEYVAQDGLELDGVLTLPPNREGVNLPAIILPHGGPHAHDSLSFDWLAQAFASRGYAVFQPNFRGSTGRGEHFMRAGYGEWGRKMQTDISDGLLHLAEEGIINPSRACIVGASYGGYAALAGVTLQQGLYRCAVSVAGVADITLMYRTDRRESGGSNLLRRSLQEELGPRSGWAEVSPRRQAERADAPILLIHGRDDTVVPFDQSLVMADALDDHDKPYQLIELEGEDHWLSIAETRHRMLSEAMAFVQEHNPPD